MKNGHQGIQCKELATYTNESSSTLIRNRCAPLATVLARCTCTYYATHLFPQKGGVENLNFCGITKAWLTTARGLIDLGFCGGCGNKFPVDNY